MAFFRYRLAQQLARLGGGGAPAPKSWRTRAEKIGAAGLDQSATLQRGAAEQHAETHLVAIGERKLDRPGAFAKFEQGLDDVAALDAPTRVAHRALVDGAGFASDPG